MYYLDYPLVLGHLFPKLLTVHQLNPSSFSRNFLNPKGTLESAYFQWLKISVGIQGHRLLVLILKAPSVQPVCLLPSTSGLPQSSLQYTFHTPISGSDSVSWSTWPASIEDLEQTLKFLVFIWCWEQNHRNSNAKGFFKKKYGGLAEKYHYSLKRNASWGYVIL